MKHSLFGLGWALGAVVTVTALPARVHAEPPALRAQLICQRAASPGRIVCELSTSAASGRLVWSDGLVVRAPSFAPPLRSRCVAKLESATEPGVAKAKLALVASTPGRGQLELLARGVVCREGPNGEWCAPEVVPVSALVDVGPLAPESAP